MKLSIKIQINPIKRNMLYYLDYKKNKKMIFTKRDENKCCNIIKLNEVKK